MNIGTYVRCMARGRGSVIRVREGVYRLRVDAGNDPVTGRRRQPSRTVRGTRRDAQEALNRWLVDLATGGPGCGELTIRSLFERWIEAPGKGGVIRRPSSVYREQKRFERHLQPMFGDRQARSITSGEVARWYDSLLTSGGLSSTSVHRIHEMLSAMFCFGVSRDLLTANPLSKVTPPSVVIREPRAPEFEALGEHLRRLRVSNRRLWLALRLIATLGLRRSDVLALRWRHIDLETGQVRIHEGVTWVPGHGLVVSSTKTGHAGTATLFVDDELLAELRAQFQSVVEHTSGDDQPVDDYFVLASNGLDSHPLHSDSLTKAVTRHCAANPDLEPFTPQMLRVFTSSELEGSGVDITTAQAVLRHRTPQTTMKHYRAVRDHRLRQATRDLGLRLASS